MELQLDFEDVLFGRVKHKSAESVEIAFAHGSDEYAVKLTDGPHPEFIASLAALGPHALGLCSVPVRDEHPVEVRGLVIKHDKEGDRSVVVTVLRRTGTGKMLVLNTPLSSWYELGAAMRKGIDEVCWQAWLYLNGRRAQQEMDFDEAKARAAGEEMTARLRERLGPEGADVTVEVQA